VLNKRQERFYQDRANVYKPQALTTKTGSVRMKDRKVSASPIATNIPCMMLSKPEASEAGVIGRSEKDLVMFSLDRFRFAADQKADDGSTLQVDDGYIIQLKTPGHPDYDGWWICQGGSKIRIRRTRRDVNIQTVNCKRTTQPFGVE
jgi:hypothetical protein